MENIVIQAGPRIGGMEKLAGRKDRVEAQSIRPRA